MTAKTDIKFYVYTNNGAPQLENRFGCMLDVLDACLVNGFGTQNVASTSINDKEITLKFNQSHNFLQYQVIKITGADQTQLNNEHRILSVTDNTVIFKIDNVLTNITGTLICSLPPLGFEKPFSSKNNNGGGKGAYRSTNTLLASRPFLRVVDELDPVYNATYAKYAKVGIVENMSDIDTLLGTQAPYDSSSPNKNWVGSGSTTSAYNGWAKWYYARNTKAIPNYGDLCYDTQTPSNNNRTYFLIGSDHFFYIFCSCGPEYSTQLQIPYAFLSIRNGETWSIACQASYTKLSEGNRASAYTDISQQKVNESATSSLFNCSTTFPVSITTTVRLSKARDTAILSGADNYIESGIEQNEVVMLPVFLLGLNDIAKNTGVFLDSLPSIHWLARANQFAELQTYSDSSATYIAKFCYSSSAIGQVCFEIF